MCNMLLNDLRNNMVYIYILDIWIQLIIFFLRKDKITMSKTKNKPNLTELINNVCSHPRFKDFCNTGICIADYNQIRSIVDCMKTTDIPNDNHTILNYIKGRSSLTPNMMPYSIRHALTPYDIMLQIFQNDKLIKQLNYTKVVYNATDVYELSDVLDWDDECHDSVDEFIEGNSDMQEVLIHDILIDRLSNIQCVLNEFSKSGELSDRKDLIEFLDHIHDTDKLIFELLYLLLLSLCPKTAKLFFVNIPNSQINIHYTVYTNTTNGILLALIHSIYNDTGECMGNEAIRHITCKVVIDTITQYFYCNSMYDGTQESSCVLYLCNKLDNTLYNIISVNVLLSLKLELAIMDYDLNTNKDVYLIYTSYKKEGIINNYSDIYASMLYVWYSVIADTTIWDNIDTLISFYDAFNLLQFITSGALHHLTNQHRSDSLKDTQKAGILLSHQPNVTYYELREQLPYLWLNLDFLTRHQIQSYSIKDIELDANRFNVYCILNPIILEKLYHHSIEIDLDYTSIVNAILTICDMPEGTALLVKTLSNVNVNMPISTIELTNKYIPNMFIIASIDSIVNTIVLIGSFHITQCAFVTLKQLCRWKLTKQLVKCPINYGKIIDDIEAYYNKLTYRMPPHQLYLNNTKSNKLYKFVEIQLKKTISR